MSLPAQNEIEQKSVKPSWMRTHRGDILALLYLLLLAGLLIGPLWSQPGLPLTADGTLHLHRAAEMSRSLANGILWPRWFPAVYGGLGAPVFHYYSPSFYLFTAVPHLAGIPLDLAAKLVISVSFLLCGLAIIAWLSRLSHPAGGWAGATIYLTAPFLFREYYFQGDYPQLIAILWLPIAIWGLTRLFYHSSWPNWILGPICLAVFITTHNLTAMLGAAVICLYWLALPLWHRDIRGWLRGIAAGLLSIALTAFFWLPALADHSLVQISNLRENFFHYAQYFLTWRDLLAPPPLLDASAANPPFPHMLGWGAWLTVALGSIALVLRPLRKAPLRAGRVWGLLGATILAGFLFLTLDLSTPIWEGVPALALAQFPGRLLGVAAIGVILLALPATTVLSDRGRWVACGIIILAAGVLSGVFLFPRHPFVQTRSLTPADTQSYELESGAWGTTSGNEFLPKWAQAPEISTDPEFIRIFYPPDADWIQRSPHRFLLGIREGIPFSAGTITVPLHYFPAWQAKAGGSWLLPFPSPDGLLSFDLPVPTDSIVIRWRGTAWQTRGEWLSRIAALLWLGLVILSAGRPKPEGQPTARWRKGESWKGPLAMAILVALFLAGRWGIQTWNLGWFQQSSPPGTALPAKNPLDVTLGGGDQPAARLIGWELLARFARPESKVMVRLYWHLPERSDQDLHSFIEIHEPVTQERWAGSQNQNPGRIPTSSWIPSLYYVDDLVLTLPEDIPAAHFVLSAGMVDENGRRLAVADNPHGLVSLGEIEVQPLRAGWKQPALPDVSAEAGFGEDLKLQGYDLIPDPGGPILRLFWEVRLPPRGDWQTFIHLIGPDGNRISQFDRFPLNGLRLTRDWPVGALMIDRQKLWLPDELQMGTHVLLVGLYDSRTGERLAISPEPEALAQFDIEASALRITFDIP